MIRVRQLRRRLERALARCEECPGPTASHSLERAIPPAERAVWMAAELTHRAEAQGVRVPGYCPPAGCALGVIAQTPTEASLVWLEVRHASPGGPLTAVGRAIPGPAALAAEAVDSLWRAASLAVSLYPHYWPLDPRRDLVFNLQDLDGQQVELGDGEPVSGGSLGLTALVATWSLLTGRAVDKPWVFSGALSADRFYANCEVLEVTRRAAKLREASAAGAVFVAAGCDRLHTLDPTDTRWRPADKVDSTLGRVFGKDWDSPDSCPLPDSFDAGVALGVLDMTYQRADGLGYASMAGRFEALGGAPDLPPASRILALARAGACHTHVGAMDRAVPLLEQAMEAVERLGPAQVEGREEVIARTHLAVALRDLYRMQSAADQARAAWNLAQQLRLHQDGINARSTLGQLLAGHGRATEGLSHVEAARDYYDARHSPECPRNHTYVVDALSRVGQLEQAAQEHALGVKHNDGRAIPAQRRVNRLYLDLALLKGRLRNLWRTPDGSTARWSALHDETIGALRRFAPGDDPHWPMPALLHVRDAAALRCARDRGSLDQVLEGARLRLRALGDDDPMRWFCGMVLLEAALVGLDRGHGLDSARALALEGLAAARDLGDSYFALWIKTAEAAESGEALREAVVGALAAESY